MTFNEAVAKAKALTDRYQHLEYGCTHVVLSDFNFEPKFCQAALDSPEFQHIPIEARTPTEQLLREWIANPVKMPGDEDSGYGPVWDSESGAI